MKRRDFIKLTSLSILPIFNNNKLYNLISNTTLNKNNYLILIELKGGNDGINTVIPYNDNSYYNLRPDISINRDKILKISEELGFNPNMESIYELWKTKELAIICGVGYPNPNRSHFRSIEIWETASNSQTVLDDGWIAQAFKKYKERKKIDGLVLGGSDFGSLIGKNMKNLIIENTEQFIKEARKVKKVPIKTNNEALKHILQVENQIYDSYEILEEYLDYVPEIKTSFPQSNLGNQSLTAFKIISSKVPVSVIKLELTGFDTHINQLNNHGKLLKDLSDSILALKKALSEVNMWNNTTIMTYSEFGRRAYQNGNNGTDHGTASVHFITGGQIKGGVYGKYPSLDDLLQGDLKYNIDYRSLYSTISKKLWNISPDFLVKYPTLDIF
ncbi:MAG: DUF1501 domain-containing protein [Candidatus Sericytochromatia bacterium]